MQSDTNVPMNSEAICLQNVNIELVVQLVDTLYNSKNPADQADANRRLTELQSSDKAWQICWPLLDPNQFWSVEVHFFAANTLVSKINQCWSQQNQEWLENNLRPKLFETLVNYASSPNSNKLVVERLSLALANFALHSIPTFWPDAINDILQTFAPQSLHVNLSPQRICDILLKILMYLPEEYAILVPQQEHRAKLNQQMTRSGPIVFKFLHSLLIADKSTITSECKQNVLKCLTSWTLHSRASLLELDDGKLLIDLLYNLVVDDELCSSACAALAATFSHQKSENYRNSLIEFIPKLAKLGPIIEKFIHDDEIECAIKIYSLVINFSENHSRLFLKVVLKDGIELEYETWEITRRAIFSIITIILDCTSAPGIYGIDEKYSDISFTFWFTFFENFYYYSDNFNDLICETFSPLVDSLLEVFVRKLQYPPSTTFYQTWNDDMRESYRCYRQDLGDNISLIVQFPRSRERILERLHNNLEQELSRMSQDSYSSNGEKIWQGFESIVFALKSIAESVPFDEVRYIPKIFNRLSQVHFGDSNTLLYCTVAEMISAYSDWLYVQPTHLATAFNILFLGVDSTDSQVRLMSTLSLKDLTSECQTVLLPFAPQIVQSCTAAILQSNSTLSTSAKSRLMHTVGTALAMSPHDFVVSSLRSLTTPILCDLSAKAQENPTLDATCRPVIYDRIELLNSLIESLYVKQYSGNDYENDDENDIRAAFEARTEELEKGNTIQPTLHLLGQLVPILRLISSKYQSDEDLMGLISNTIKRSAKSLGVEVEPILEDLLAIIVNAYDPLLNSNILEGSLPLYMLFKSKQGLQQLLIDAFIRVSEKTLEVCMAHPLRQLSLTIESYFKYATFVCKRLTDFLSNPTIAHNIEYIYKLAVASLELPEKRTLAEVCNFLTQYRLKSIGVSHLHRTFINNLDVLLANIFNIFGGNYSTPRNAIEHVIDLLYVVADADEVKEPLKLVVEKDDFPTHFANREQKAKFVTKIIHEKNRRKFKDACSDFVLLVRNLNRSSS